MNVLLLSRYDNMGASSRIRSLQYLPRIERTGIHVCVSPLFPASYLMAKYRGDSRYRSIAIRAFLQRTRELIRCKKFDLVWMEKELFPWLPAFAERFLRILDVPYIVDFDDAIFHRYDKNPRKWIRTFLGKKIDTVMRHAEIVIAGNAYLADRAVSSGASRVEVIPSVIDLEKYPQSDEAERDTFVIGWIGSPTTAPYLELIRSALETVIHRHKAKLLLVGAGKNAFHGGKRDIRKWHEKTEAGDISEFDVGIMPLPNEPWALGKCGYKLIQYMACGRPVVASDVGANRDIVLHGRTGYLADSMEDWVKYLETLILEKTLRFEMGREGRKRVEKLYCTQVTAPVLSNLLKSAGKVK